MREWIACTLNKQASRYKNTLAEIPTSVSTFLVPAVWLKVKFLESYIHQPEGLVGRKSIRIQRLQFSLPGTSICCRPKHWQAWQGGLLPSEEAKCPSEMSQWENGTREWVILGEEAKGSSLLKDILGFGRFLPLVSFRYKFGACDCSG